MDAAASLNEVRPVHEQLHQRQRLLTFGTELWDEVKGHVVEFNESHMEFCKECSICLLNFELR